MAYLCRFGALPFAPWALVGAVAGRAAPPIRFHDLRHSYVALSIAEAAHPKYIKQQFGHASITTALDTYGHLFPGFHQGEAERLGALVLEETGGHNLVTNAGS